MNDIEYQKLQLLSFSKKRVTFAENGDWESLSSIEIEWNQMIERAINNMGENMAVMVPSLIEDMDFVLAKLKKAQGSILDASSSNQKRANDIKKYLV